MEKRFLTRRQAADYVTARFFPCKISFLAKLAVVGGGPVFRKAGQAALYEPHRLDEWAQSRIGHEIKTTSELGNPRVESRGRPRKVKASHERQAAEAP
jgi:hypothetical protein